MRTLRKILPFPVVKSAFGLCKLRTGTWIILITLLILEIDVAMMRNDYASPRMTYRNILSLVFCVQALIGLNMNDRGPIFYIIIFGYFMSLLFALLAGIVLISQESYAGFIEYLMKDHEPPEEESAFFKFLGFLPLPGTVTKIIDISKFAVNMFNMVSELSKEQSFGELVMYILYNEMILIPSCVLIFYFTTVIYSYFEEA